MVRGFARRSGLDVRVEIEGDLPARIPEVEATLYRLTQEALANAYRHAAASMVKVRLVARRGSVVHLLVEDDGVGLEGQMGLSIEPGVGIEGMIARVADLGGRLSFSSAGGGCRLVASIPMAAHLGARPPPTDRQLRREGLRPR
jgi:signal transduction histidine kinase